MVINKCLLTNNLTHIYKVPMVGWGSRYSQYLGKQKGSHVHSQIGEQGNSLLVWSFILFRSHLQSPYGNDWAQGYYSCTYSMTFPNPFSFQFEGKKWFPDLHTFIVLGSGQSSDLSSSHHNTWKITGGWCLGPYTIQGRREGGSHPMWIPCFP